MVKVSIVVEGHDFAVVEFGDDAAAPPQVHGSEVPEAVLQKIQKDINAGFRMGEYAEYKWQKVEGAG